MIGLVLTAALLNFCWISVSAAPGDVLYEVQATDIKTYFFDQPINAYNIGGRTVVICEDLNWYYGFDVIWNEAERALAVNDKYYNLYAYHTE